MDNIVYWSDSIEEHMEHVRLILGAIREAGLVVSMKKSVSVTNKIEFLSHIISSRGIEIAPDKTAKILAWDLPQSIQQIKEFNGLVNYISQFIPGLAHWSSILSELMK